MSRWPEVRIGALCDLINGRAFRPTDWSDNGLPIVRIQNLNDERRSFNRFSGPVRPRFLINSGDLLFSWSGTPGTSFGAFFWRRGPAILNQHIFRVIVDDRRVDAAYLRYALNAHLDRIIRQAHGGVGLQHITKGKLEGTLLPLPSLPEQKRIAAILDQADEIRRKREESLKLVDSLLESIFVDMFGPGARNHDKWDREPLAALVKSGPRAIRSGPFGSELLHSEFVSEGVPVLGIDNVVQNRFAWGESRFITQTKYQQLQRFTVFPQDVLITIMATIGRTAVAPVDLPLAISTKHLATLTPAPSRLRPYFLAHALRWLPEVQVQLQRQGHGAIMSGLNLSIIKGLRIPVPDIAEQIRYSNIVESVDELRSKTLSAFAGANELSVALSERAFAGNL